MYKINVFGLAVGLSFSWDRCSPWGLHLSVTESASNYIFYIHFKRNLFLDLLALFCGGIPTFCGYVFQRERAFHHFQFLLGLRDPSINEGYTWSDYLERHKLYVPTLDDILF
jgi:hypothetical protein